MIYVTLGKEKMEREEEREGWNDLHLRDRDILCAHFWNSERTINTLEILSQKQLTGKRKKKRKKNRIIQRLGI